jgi:ASCH domain
VRLAFQLWSNPKLVDIQSMLALSIRQPYLELILRGIKTAELRTQSTRIIDQPFYLYAAKSFAKPLIWSNDLQVDTPPDWMVELARQIKLIPKDLELPTGVIVGTARIDRVVEPKGKGDPFAWVLKDVERWATPKKPDRHPQPVWWRPF